jgi:OOP family OmpA-OmpF porin
LPISEGWAVVGGADAALLYTSFNDIGGGVVLSNASYWQFIPQVGGELGVSWRSSDSPSFSFTTGARIATSFNTSITSNGSRQGSLVEYGPFVRMAYNFAGPSRSQRMAVKEEREIWTNAPPTGSQRYVVHFAFEDSGINPVAASTIRQAADDIRRGRPADIAIASADIDNGSDYSRALSRRRAEAIREALARHGILPSQVEIVAAGDAPPLAPASGSVRVARSAQAQITF